jgi:DNA (cytosine-5)-methyltransferase 1
MQTCLAVAVGKRIVVDCTPRRLAGKSRSYGAEMDFLELLNSELPAQKTRSNRRFRVLDLFAGCGGLALGFEAVGFETLGYEMMADACETYTKNLAGHCNRSVLEPGQELIDKADVVIGGPPCQPFSVVGNQRGKKDRRDGFPAFLSAVERYQPELAMFENVRGMLYRNLHYFEHIVEQLKQLGYLVEWQLLNAVEFGVPQRRERLFVVAHRGKWVFPKPQRPSRYFTAGDALEGLAFVVDESTRFLTESMDRYVAKYERASCCIRPRDTHLDEPSRTVTCRNLNGATGDMLRIRLPDGRRKRLSVREGARLQTFPDWFEFCGSQGSQFNQIGNAVPPLLAKAVAGSVMEYLQSDERLSASEVARANRRGKQVCFEFGE